MPVPKKKGVPYDTKLRTTHARVLKVLMPRRPDFPPSEWPLLTRIQLGQRAGFKSTSGSITRVLNGIRPGNTTSGKPHLGVIDSGLVEVIELDVDGVTEDNYRITRAGIVAYQRYIEENGDNLPAVKDATVHTNRRYLKEGE